MTKKDEKCIAQAMSSEKGDKLATYPLGPITNYEHRLWMSKFAPEVVTQQPEPNTPDAINHSALLLVDFSDRKKPRLRQYLLKASEQ